jgi:hypothetical protein
MALPNCAANFVAAFVRVLLGNRHGALEQRRFNRDARQPGKRQIRLGQLDQPAAQLRILASLVTVNDGASARLMDVRWMM